MNKRMLVGMTLTCMLACMLAGYQTGLAQEQKKVPVVAGSEKAATNVASVVKDASLDWAGYLDGLAPAAVSDGTEESVMKAAKTAGTETVDKTDAYSKPQIPSQAEVQTPACVVIEWMSSRQEYSRYFPSMNGTWIDIRVRNNCDQRVSRLSAKVAIPDRLHDTVFDTVRLDFENLSLRSLDPGKALVLQAQLGSFQMPGNWQYGVKFDGRIVDVISVTFKNGSIWRK